MKTDSDELEVMSIRTMAQETLGEWGGAFASVMYVFLGYTSVVAYCSKSGDILHHLTDFPGWFCGSLFTFLFTILTSIGGSRATDQVNQWLTASMIGFPSGLWLVFNLIVFVVVDLDVCAHRFACSYRGCRCSVWGVVRI